MVRAAIRRAALLTTEESKGVRMAFSKKGLVLTSRSPESGEATVNFPGIGTKHLSLAWAPLRKR